MDQKTQTEHETGSPPLRTADRDDLTAVHMRWRGASGTSYDYWVIGLGARIKSGSGNYIFAKRNISGGWDAIYLGHGDLTQAADLDHHYKGELIRSKGATHVHVRENFDETSRMIERSDLLEVHPEAYAPKGCNSPAA